jgi:hypothetical protein
MASWWAFAVSHRRFARPWPARRFETDLPCYIRQGASGPAVDPTWA